LGDVVINRVVIVALVSLLSSGVVRAQEPSDDAKKAAVLEEARQHNAKAKVHYDLGEFKDAAEEYIIVYRLRPIPALLFNVAQAYRQAGLYDKARQFYKSYLRESPDAKNKATIELAIKDMDDLLANEKHAKEKPPNGVKEAPEASLPIKTPPAQGATPSTQAATPPAQVATATPAPAKETPKVTPPAAVATPASPWPASPKQNAATTQPTPGGKVASSGSASSPGTVTSAPARSDSIAAGRPASTFGVSSTPPPAHRQRTWTWVAAGGSALALGGGALVGAKSINSAKPSDAHTANALYGVGVALAIASAALFVFEF
jgi:tetratricopeptide (TPR) repeat protein